LLAGVDMDMESNAYFQHLAQLVRSGAVPEAAVDEAVRRILRVKFALGLFDNPYAPEPKGAPGPISPAYLQAAREAAERTFVLLKNDAAAGGAPVLPIANTARTVALIGPLADSRQDMLGPWAASGKPEDVVTLHAALAERARGGAFKLLNAKGTEIRGDSEAGFAEAVDAARQADVVLLALGEEAGSMTGEAASRAFLDLPGNQQQLLEAVAAVGKPTVLVLFSGRPLALTPAVGRVQAVLEAWFPGVQAGPALARVLFGEASPTGRLTMSFPRSVGQVPLYYSQLSTGRPAGAMDLSRPPGSVEGDKYVSRFIDEQNRPLFPFGFGLSYTTFSYSPPTVSAPQVGADALNRGQASIRVSAEVRNTGQRPGEEVVQLYIRLRGTSVARPVRELKGYQRVALAPNEAKRVEFTLGRDELSFWNIDMKNTVEPAELTVWVAPDSQSGTEAKVAIQ
jgi:beta-glucosidase